MRYFTIPADFKKSSIDIYSEMNHKYSNSQLVEIYGQIIKGKIMNSGRISDSIPDISFLELKDYIGYSKEKGINFNYTFNASCLGNYEFTSKGILEVKSFINELMEAGVDTFTVASPILMEIIKEVNDKANIVASTICEINSANKAVFYKKLGVTRIVVDADITRDFNRLSVISNVFGDCVEIIVNNTCLRNCAYKMFHYNHDSHCADNAVYKSQISYYPSRCAIQKYEKPENILKLNWIRPEDLKYYENVGIHYFKIQGRPNVLRGKPTKTLMAYFEQSYDGNLCELLTMFFPSISRAFIDNKKLDGFIDKFYKSSGFCNDNCDECKYCFSYAEKCMDIESAKKDNADMYKIYKSLNILEV
jgi:hypothetical protein